MKNMILPSVSPQFYSFGSMSDHSISEVPAQIDSTLNFYGNGFFYTESNFYNNHFDFAIPPQLPMDYHSGLSSIMSMKRLDYPYDEVTTCPSCTSIYDSDPLQQLPFTKKLTIPQHLNNIQTIQNPRKRPIVASEEDYKITMTDSIDVNQWKTNKKTAHQEQRPSQDKKQKAIEIPREKVPVRRSQKFSDKITALQKLVSPYGKTDTASVLEEASISIILLQHQIQTLYKKLSSSSINTEHRQYQQRTGEKLLDLRSRGLCLVPVSFTQILTKEEQFNRQEMSRSYAMPRN